MRSGAGRGKSLPGESRYSLQGQRKLNPNRLTADLLVAFCAFFFGGRQPTGIRNRKNHLKIPRCKVRGSFCGADFCRDKANAAGNT